MVKIISLLTGLLLYPAVTFGFGLFPMQMVTVEVVSGGCSSVAFSYITNTNGNRVIGQYLGALYGGILWTSSGITINNVCGMSFQLRRVGDTGIDYVAKAYTTTPPDLVTVQSTSSIVSDISIALTYAETLFPFPTPFTITTDVAVAIVPVSGVNDSARYLEAQYNSVGVEASMYGGNWRDTLVANGVVDATDFWVRIYVP